MGLNRGKRKNTRGKIRGWRGKTAACGRKPTMGKRRHFASWGEVRAQIQQNETKIVMPERTEEQKAADKAARKAEG